MIREEEIFFKMIKEVRVKYRFENFSYNRRESNWSVVGAVTHLRNRLNKCVLPRKRIGSSFSYEAKKTTKHRCQLKSEVPHNMCVCVCVCVCVYVCLKERERERERERKGKLVSSFERENVLRKYSN